MLINGVSCEIRILDDVPHARATDLCRALGATLLVREPLAIAPRGCYELRPVPSVIMDGQPWAPVGAFVRACGEK